MVRDKDELDRVRRGLTKFFSEMVSAFGGDDVVLELMSHRGYNTEEMFNTLKNFGVFRVDYLSEIGLVTSVDKSDLAKWGLLTESGEYMLSGRFVLPIRDIKGRVASLVGWNPLGGSRKYVTTPTFGFSRDVSFFNLDCYRYAWDSWNGCVYFVEGIFDTLSLVSLGLPAIGNQGLEMSLIKSQILRRFGKVIAIPDNDSSGRSVIPYLNATSGKSRKFIWKIENSHVFALLPEGVKDVDEFVRDFECYDDLIALQDKSYLVRLKED